MTKCANCETVLQASDKFCPNCGQKNNSGKITLWDFLKELLDTVFIVESRTFKTAAALFIPGKLTKDYFEGKRQRYLHPVRIFMFCTVAFLAITGFRVNQWLGQEAEEIGATVSDYGAQSELLLKIDSLNKILPKENAALYPQRTMDSLCVIYPSRLLSGIDMDGLAFTYDNNGVDVEIPVEKLYMSDPDELAKENGIDNFFGKLMLRQFIHFSKEPNKFIQSSIGNLIWMVVLLMPAIALFLKLLYFRSNRYFVEHLFFSLHFNAFAFVIMGLVLLLFPNNGLPIFIAQAISCIFLLWAMQRYYAQAIWKTIIKWIFLLNAYLFTILIFIGITIGISFMIF